mmetsp:Transcript_20985/g.85540  ORF Transcript_20985/g.85540 Transcript_20985/m.85540 type:complete len:189 (+) Transcript_20985:3229-3795(+)
MHKPAACLEHVVPDWAREKAIRGVIRSAQKQFQRYIPSQVRIEVDTKEPLARVKLLLLEKQGVELVKSYGENGPVQVIGSVDVNGQLSKELVALGRVVSMEKADVEAALRSGSSLIETGRSECVREQVEAESRVWLKKILEEKLAEYEDAGNDDEESDEVQTQFYAMARSLCRLEVAMIRKAVGILSS